MNFISRLKLNWYDDRATKRLINSGEYDFTRQPTRILDLGAHKGFATFYFAKKYPNTTIHAYEPNPKLFRALQRRTRHLPNVFAFNEAITGFDGVIHMTFSERNVSSSIFTQGTSSSRILATSLKTAVQRIGAPVSVKIDIEGAEYDALSFNEGIAEIVGELHPEKAGRSNEEIRSILSRFSQIQIADGKSIFRAI